MITVTPEPLAVPPRNVITVSVSSPVDSDELIQSITVFRVVDGVRTALRQQPAPGSAEIVAYDYEAPYGVPVFYEWVGSFVDQSARATEFVESWADLSAWSVSGGAGSFGVSGGELTFTGSGFSPTLLTRAVTVSAYTFVIEGVPNGAQANASVTVGTVVVDLRNQRWRVGSGVWRVIPVSGSSYDLTVSLLPSGVQVETVAGTDFEPIVPSAVSSVVVSAVQDVDPLGSTVMGEFSAFRPASASDAGDVSALVVLAPSSGWLIHPTRVNRSVKVDGQRVDVVSTGPVVNRSARTLHQVMGARFPIVTANGPRLSDEFTMTFYLEDEAGRLEFTSLLDDQTPILLNLVPSQGVGVAPVFVSVDDVEYARMAQLPFFEPKHVRLPLIAVAPPVDGVAETGWSNAVLAVEFASSDAVVAAFASNNDLTLNVRR